MITAADVRAVWTAPRSETFGELVSRLGRSSLAVFFIQNVTRGMSDRGAAQWVNELLARSSTAGAALDSIRRRYPSRVRRAVGTNLNLLAVQP